jgi:hypothetical protein
MREREGIKCYWKFKEYTGAPISDNILSFNLGYVW